MSSLFGDLPPPAQDSSSDTKSSGLGFVGSLLRDGIETVKSAERKKKKNDLVATTTTASAIPSLTTGMIKPKSVRRRPAAGVPQPVPTKAPLKLKSTKASPINELKDNAVIGRDSTPGNDIQQEVQVLARKMRSEGAYDPLYPNDYSEYIHEMNERRRKEVAKRVSKGGEKRSKDPLLDGEETNKGDVRVEIVPEKSITDREGEMMDAISSYCNRKLPRDSYRIELCIDMERGGHVFGLYCKPGGVDFKRCMDFDHFQFRPQILILPTLTP